MVSESLIPETGSFRLRALSLDATKFAGSALCGGLSSALALPGNNRFKPKTGLVATGASQWALEQARSVGMALLQRPAGSFPYLQLPALARHDVIDLARSGNRIGCF